MVFAPHGLEFCAKGWCVPIVVDDKDAPQDSELPGLPRFLDANYMARFLERGQRIEKPSAYALNGCRIVFLRYKPSRYCNVFYDLSFENKSGTSCQHILIAGKVVCEKLATRTRPDVTALHLPSPTATILHYTVFPADPRIESLHRLADRLAMQQHLRVAVGDPKLRIVAPNRNTGWAQILSYRPECYCLLRFTQQAGDGAVSETLARLFHTNHHATHAWHLMRSLWGAARNGTDDGTLIAKPLGHDENAHVCFYDVAPGAPLTTLLHQKSTRKAIHIAARALARIHTHELNSSLAAVLPIRGTHDLLTACRSIQSAAENVSNVNRDQLRLVAEKLVESAPGECHENRLLHGDYSTNQILTDGNIATAIDFSGVRGDIHIDIGNFFARLRHQLSMEQFATARQDFLQMYRGACNIQVDEHTAAWFEAMALVNDAFIPLKKLRGDWPQLVSARINLAIKLLDGL